MDNLKKLIREIPDFPKPGILFYDITTLLKDPYGFRTTIDRLTELVGDGLDRPVRKVTDRAGDTAALGDAAREIPVADALHLSRNNESLRPRHGSGMPAEVKRPQPRDSS